MCEIFHHSISIRNQEGIVARRNGEIFPRVITEETTFSLRGEDGVHRSVTIFPSFPHLTYETGGRLLVWEENIAEVDEPPENGFRTHVFQGSTGKVVVAPQEWIGESATSDSLEIKWRVPVTEIDIGSHQFHLPFALPQIVYSFSSPPRE